MDCPNDSYHNGHFQVIELLLKEHADSNQRKENRWTALMIVSHNGHFQVVELLLKENAYSTHSSFIMWTCSYIGCSHTSWR